MIYINGLTFKYDSPVGFMETVQRHAREQGIRAYVIYVDNVRLNPNAVPEVLTPSMSVVVAKDDYNG